MKRVIRHIIFTSILVIVLALSSCSKQEWQQRQRRQKFQVIALNKVRGSISDGWRVTLTIANNTASNVRITSANAFVRQNGRKIGRVVLDGEVVLPRRCCSQVDVPLRITLANPIAALGVLNNIRKGNFDGVTIDYSITISALTSHRIFEKEGVSLEALAQQFNFGLKK